MESIKKKLDAIIHKISENSVSAWNDKLEDTHNVAILEDFKKLVDEDDAPVGYDCDEDEDELGTVEYNGWLEELIALRDELNELEI